MFCWTRVSYSWQSWLINVQFYSLVNDSFNRFAPILSISYYFTDERLKTEVKVRIVSSDMVKFDDS
jgi:hypothetical protein